MTTVVLGCDRNNGNDSKVQNTVAKALEKQGYNVEKLSIAPGPFADYDYGNGGKNPKGKIGVYIIADGIFSIADHYNNSGGFKYCYFVIRGDLGRSRMDSRRDFEKNPIGSDADCTGICAQLSGKTFPQMNEICKKKCHIVFGTTAEEMASELIQAMGGKVNSSSSSKSDSASSCKEALTDVLYNWDGEVECYIRDDTVHIRKIPSPLTATLRLIEGQNIDFGSINVTDYNPSAVNYLSCTFKDYTLSIKDDYLIKRFGKISSTVKIDKSIKKLDDAKKFLQREWNKLKRDNGHSLECKTYGHSKWRIGEWCRVYLPSFNIDDYMYITKVSQDDSGDSEWSCNLTLVDYPPGFGEPSKTETDEKESKKSSDSS
ncbi:hypothetical protein [Methanobrevibacter sp.]